MDDPSLSPSLQRTALDGPVAGASSPPVFAYHVTGENGVRAADDVEIRLWMSLEGDGERIPMEPAVPQTEAARGFEETADWASVETQPSTKPKRSTLAGAIVSLVTGVLLGSAAWFLLQESGWTGSGWTRDPLWLSGAVAAAGILVGASVWRSKSHRT